MSDGAGGKGLLQLAAGGAPSVVAPRGPNEAALAVPQLLPGGKAILFVAAAGGGGADAANIEVLTLAGGRRKTLVQGGHSPHYLSSNGAGHLLYVNKATLFAIHFDPETLETRGTAVPVLDDVAFGLTGTGHFAVSRTGTLISPPVARRCRGHGDGAVGLSSRRVHRQAGAAAGHTRRLWAPQTVPGRHADRAGRFRGSEF